MADIEHANLPDELLHEPKGASTATSGSVYVANGQGSGQFKHLNLSDLEFNKDSLQAYDTPGNPRANLIQGMTAPTGSSTLTPIPNYPEVPTEYTSILNMHLEKFIGSINSNADVLNYYKDFIRDNRKAIQEITAALKKAGIVQ